MPRFSMRQYFAYLALAATAIAPIFVYAQGTPNPPLRINQFPPPPAPVVSAPAPAAPSAAPTQAPARPTHSPTGDDAVDSAAAEIQAMKPDLSKLEGMDLQKVMEMAKGLGLGNLQSLAGQTPGAPGAEAAGVLGTLGALGSSPLAQKAQKLAFDKDAQQAMGKMFATPNRTRLWIYEGIFFVMMFFLKNFELSRIQPGEFGRRIWVNMRMTLINFLGLAVVVPFIFFGQPYLDLLKAIVRVFGS